MNQPKIEFLLHSCFNMKLHRRGKAQAHSRQKQNGTVPNSKITHEMSEKMKNAYR